MAAPSPIVYVPSGREIQWDAILHMPISTWIKVILFLFAIIVIFSLIIYKARKTQNHEE
jgi:hypothetical protein